MRCGTILWIILLLSPGLGFADTLDVPGEYLTIQQAILVASDGDTVRVAAGTYLENLDFLGKAITVRSADGPDLTHIDGGKNGSVASFLSGEGKDSRLEGFTVENGHSYQDGGGIVCEGASPTIWRNVIAHNFAGQHGGGIACVGGAEPHIFGNVITGNMSTQGGGIYCRDGSPLISGNIIARNTATPNPFLSFGGGIRCYEASPLILGNTIAENTASGNGLGGGLDCWNASPEIVNTILWGNQAVTGPQVSASCSVMNPSSVSFSYSDVEGGQGSLYIGTGCSHAWGPGMIDMDPLFADGDHDDYHLLHTSPCRDGGDSGAPQISMEDFEGDPRAAESGADMGADEFHLHLYWVGEPNPGKTVDVKVTGLPLQKVMLFVGDGLLDPPWNTFYGTWHLKLPLIAIPMDPTPWQGLVVFHGIIPSSYPAPTWIPLQALVGSKVTNPIMVVVR